MHEQEYEKMEDACVEVKYDTPQWQNANEDIVGEEEYGGCIVTLDIIHPEMCIVMDKVGSNASQKANGNNGGELHIITNGIVPQQKAGTKEIQFTLLELMALKGDAIMCGIFFHENAKQSCMNAVWIYNLQRKYEMWVMAALVGKMLALANNFLANLHGFSKERQYYASLDSPLKDPLPLIFFVILLQPFIEKSD